MPTSAQAAPLIEMIDARIISLRSPAISLLEEVNWRIAPGDFWVVGGLPNSGKTDLLATAAGLMRPSAGILKLFGRNTHLREGDALLEERLRIGLVFGEGGRFFDHLTVFENVALAWCYYHNTTLEEARARVEMVLAMTGLETLTHYSSGRLNHGWRQRVALARALMLAPEVLLLDNPLGGLDPRQTAWWISFLNALGAGHDFYQGKPLTLVMATENFHPWLSGGHTFAILHQKRWIPLGNAPQIRQTTDPALQDLLAQMGFAP